MDTNISSSSRELPVVDVAKFSWTGNRGFAEFSTFPMVLGSKFLVVGRKTSIDFVRTGERRSPEGELEAVYYRSVCGRFHVTVFND